MAASDDLQSGAPSQAPTVVTPIVGIGASAGGLEALEVFLANTPTDSGLAYVIVQHMDPTHSGAMVQLLQRATKTPVSEASDGLVVEPDHVYVIPPNAEMSLVGGALHITPPTDPRGARRPIDAFLTSLAREQGAVGVGVILSGMGADGTAGLRLLHEQGGATFAQDCESARFPGMPGSAIAAGAVDVSAPVEDLPRLIAERVRVGAVAAAAPPDADSQSGLQRIVAILRDRTGHDFSQYKKSTLYRRIERRMAAHQIGRIATYARLLGESAQESDLLFRELLIGVTRFFRDPRAWQQLRDEVFPALIAAAPAHGRLRAWVAGCASGEEAYSVAISFLEALEACAPEQACTLQVFATDLDADAITRARAGVYPGDIATDVSAERLERYFGGGEGVYQVNKRVRDMVVFAPHNVLMDPPFTKLDLLVCRNLLIYLEPAAQHRLLPVFHYSLRPGGVLFLGGAETALDTSLFEPLERENRLYRRTDGKTALSGLHFPGRPSRGADDTRAGEDWPSPGRETPTLEAAVEQALLHRFGPAAVLTNDQGDILYVSGHTGGYLEPPAGRANWNVFAMAREGLRYPLAAAFQESAREWKEVRLGPVRIASEGGARIGALTIHPFDGVPGLVRPVLIVFEPLVRPPSRRERGETADAQQFATLREELLQTREAERAAQEVLRTVQEELTSSNEELQSTNEELQSTNEELTTSYEEMQSLNEELQTVNHELQSRVSDLSRVNDDMANLLNSTDIATLFLDSALCIRRFTPAATSIMKLIDGDVGRPVTDLVTALDYPGFADDAREVLRTLAHSQQQVRARDGRWFQVRIMPYRTVHDRIDGAVITFTDVSAAKALEQVLGGSGVPPGAAAGQEEGDRP